MSTSDVVRYPDFVNEITTDCLVVKTTASVLNIETPVIFTYKALWDLSVTNNMITVYPNL